MNIAIHALHPAGVCNVAVVKSVAANLEETLGSRCQLVQSSIREFWLPQWAAPLSVAYAMPPAFAISSCR